MLSDERIKEMRERTDKATPGPWKVVEKGNTVKSVAVTTFAVAWSPQEMICPNMSPKTGNADFIAHSRTDIPELLAEITRLKESNKELVACADEISENHAEKWANISQEITRLKAENERFRDLTHETEKECMILKAENAELRGERDAAVELIYNHVPSAYTRDDERIVRLLMQKSADVMARKE